ncbi:MAG: fldI2 [Firmicutes bacterium]|nr:fldI2 [Bacillota bacterium]
MNYYLGIDGGSTYIKAALISDDGVVGVDVRNTGINNSNTAEKMLDQLMESANINRNQLKFIMATGYSRKGIEIADDNVSEITAHGYGISITAPQGGNPSIIIDIGGQDSKIIYLDENCNVKNFVMNDKCAAGTGKFLEVAAKILETEVQDIGPLSLKSEAPCDINNTCIVFAQSEIISLVARKFDRIDILAGLHASMARRIAKMTRKSEIKGDILMTGGGALNIGLKAAFESEFMTEVLTAQHPQFNGAIGAAVLARRKVMENNLCQEA